MPSEWDVVGVGLNATDTLILVSRMPRYGGKAPYYNEMTSTGGQVASAVVTCQKLGLRSKYIGSVGDDERGRIQLKSLRESGVDIEHVQIRENCPNQSAYIIIDQATGERTIFWAREDCLRIDPGQISPEQITRARMLHIDGHDTAAVEHAARIASEAGMPVSVDVDTIYPGFDRVMPYADYLVASTEFPANWTREPDPFRALEMLRDEYGMKMAAMTLGADGALALSDDGFHYSPAFVVNCVDTTGAGDVFHGALCYAVLERYPLDNVLEFSNAMAALNCKAMGARGGIQALETAKQLIATGERRVNKEFAKGSSARRRK